MNRRRIIAMVAGLGTISGCLGDRRRGGGGDGGVDEDGDDDIDDDPAPSPPADPDPPFDVSTVDAPGSEAGTVTVPRPDAPTLVNCAQVTCTTCRKLVPIVGEAIDQLEDQGYDCSGDDPDLHVVTAIDPTIGRSPSPEELAEWWVDHGGSWTVGVDDGGAIASYYEVRTYPTLLLLDSEATVHWRSVGATTARTITSEIDHAMSAMGRSPEAESIESDGDSQP